MKKPDIKAMLPTQAKEALVEYIYYKMENDERLDYDYEPWYKYQHFMDDFPFDYGYWISTIREEVYRLALDRFKSNFPLKQEGQDFYREGNGQAKKKTFKRNCDIRMRSR